MTVSQRKLHKFLKRLNTAEAASDNRLDNDYNNLMARHSRIANSSGIVSQALGYIDEYEDVNGEFIKKVKQNNTDILIKNFIDSLKDREKIRDNKDFVVDQLSDLRLEKIMDKYSTGRTQSPKAEISENLARADRFHSQLRYFDKQKVHVENILSQLSNVMEGTSPKSMHYQELEEQVKFYKKERKYISYRQEDIEGFISNIKEANATIREEIAEKRSEKFNASIIGKFYNTVKQAISVGNYPENIEGPMSKIASKLGLDDVSPTYSQGPK